MRRTISLLAALVLTAVLTSVTFALTVSSVIASCSGSTISYTVTGTGEAGETLTVTLMGNTNASGENEPGYQVINAGGTVGGTAGAQYVDSFILTGGAFEYTGTFDITGVDESVKSFRVDSNANTKSPSFNRNTCPGTEIPESPLVVLLVATAGLGAAWFVWRQSRAAGQATAA